MINNFLFTFYLILFVTVPYRLDLSGMWESYRDPDNVNEVAMGMYLLYESVVHAFN